MSLVNILHLFSHFVSPFRYEQSLPNLQHWPKTIKKPGQERNFCNMESSGLILDTGVGCPGDFVLETCDC